MPRIFPDGHQVESLAGVISMGSLIANGLVQVQLLTLPTYVLCNVTGRSLPAGVQRSCMRRAPIGDGVLRTFTHSLFG